MRAYESCNLSSGGDMRVIVEIGNLREPVEILDEPRPAPSLRIGRIKHANGENVDIDFETLDKLMHQARAARQEELGRAKSEERFFA